MGYDLTGAYDENAKPAADYSPIPTGTYRASIIEAEIEDISKKEDKGRQLKLTWQIETGPHDGRLTWQRINMWAKNMDNLEKVLSIANEEFAAIRQATGKTIVTNTDELLQIPCDIYIGMSKARNGYEPRPEVKSVKPADNPVQQSAQQRQAAPAPQRQISAPAQQRAPAGNAPWPRKTA